MIAKSRKFKRPPKARAKLLSPAARRLALRNFLMKCRARLTPSDVGLPGLGRRQVPGLRREEVAELAGVSPRWYELFESGAGDRRFSVRFVQRVADALRLDERERACLNRLALPEVAAAAELFERHARHGASESLVRLRDLSRSVASANSFEVATLAAVRATHDLVAPDCMTVASLEKGGASPAVIAVGPRARFADDMLARMVLDMNEPVRVGATVICENAPDPRVLLDDATHPVRIRTSDGRELAGIHKPDFIAYREYNSRVRQRSGLVVGLFERSEFRGNMACFWTAPRKHPDVEIETMEAVAAILELFTERTDSSW